MKPGIRREAIGNSKKKCFGFALCAMLFAFHCTAEAQQPGKIFRIGFLASGTASGISGPRLEALRRGLRERGYVEGKNITFEYRHAEDDFERLPKLVDELINLKVDVFVINSTPAALAAKNATKSIPIVFLGVSDPVTAGLVDSLARPGGNITGFTNIAPIVTGKRLELLKEIIPKISRVAVLWDPQAPGSAQQWKESQLPGREISLQLYSMEVSSPNKYAAAFIDAVKARSAALFVTQNPLATSNRKTVTDLATKNRLPAIYPRDEFVTGGGLMSYGPDALVSYKRAAIFVDNILKGTKPADIPVEQPMKLDLVINLGAAKAIGLTIPPNVLARADRVIK
jgi:putative ABC transport system substrate-binding protein